MGSLADVIKDDKKRRVVVDDCLALIEAEVADKSGLSGMAIKAGYKTVASLKPGMIPMAMNHLLDDFAVKVDPYWQEALKGGGDVKAAFVKRKTEIANALLSITDARAAKSSHKVLVGTYNKLRPLAVEQVGQAMPRLADLLRKHAA